MTRDHDRGHLRQRRAPLARSCAEAEHSVRCETPTATRALFVG
jgi:hypothetical protein